MSIFTPLFITATVQVLLYSANRKGTDLCDITETEYSFRLTDTCIYSATTAG